MERIVYLSLMMQSLREIYEGLEKFVSLSVKRDTIYHLKGQKGICPEKEGEKDEDQKY
jgi:hypothetical protein